MGEMPATKPLPAAELPLHQRDVKQQPAAQKREQGKPFFIDYAKAKKAPTIPSTVVRMNPEGSWLPG